MGSGRRGDLVLASYRNNLSIGGAGIEREMLKEKFATARTRSPARGTRALPRISIRDICVICGFLLAP